MRNKHLFPSRWCGAIRPARLFWWTRRGQLKKVVTAQKSTRLGPLRACRTFRVGKAAIIPVFALTREIKKPKKINKNILTYFIRILLLLSLASILISVTVSFLLNRNSFDINVVPRTLIAKSGSKINFELVMHNVLRFGLLFVSSNLNNGEVNDNFVIKVYDASKSLVHKKVIGYDDVNSGGAVYFRLSTNETRAFHQDLSELYDLPQGRYTMEVSSAARLCGFICGWPAPGVRGTVGTATIEITP